MHEDLRDSRVYEIAEPVVVESLCAHLDADRGGFTSRTTRACSTVQVGNVALNGKLVTRSNINLPTLSRVVGGRSQYCSVKNRCGRAPGGRRLAQQESVHIEADSEWSDRLGSGRSLDTIERRA